VLFSEVKTGFLGLAAWAIRITECKGMDIVDDVVLLLVQVASDANKQQSKCIQHRAAWYQRSTSINVVGHAQGCPREFSILLHRIPFRIRCGAGVGGKTAALVRPSNQKRAATAPCGPSLMIG
jgi:hypothetical protein